MRTRSIISGAMATTRFATLIVILLALLPLPVKALCTQWDVSGKWNIEQENPTAHVEVDLKQSGTEITGRASYNGQPGKVKGTIVGEDFNVEISTTTGSHVFRGVVGPERIAGAISIQGASEPRIWYSTTAMKCVEAGPAPPQN
jgi:hypothetical protein